MERPLIGSRAPLKPLVPRNLSFSFEVVDVSIIICTLNRSDDLLLTLESIRQIDVPEGWTVEMLIVDNGSTDATPEVAAAFCARESRISSKYVLEPIRGQVNARNAGLRCSTGRVILFSDDDVRVPVTWLRDMAGPILSARTDAVAGGVRLAEHLIRTWMTRIHRGFLASTETISAAQPQRMVGANMSFGRHVLEKVPTFDAELGPGALGFMDDSLFSKQVLAAGFNINAAFDTPVEHHFQASRLSRSAWIARANGQGRSRAYVDYHWRHVPVRFALPKLLLATARLLPVSRARCEADSNEAPPFSELRLYENVAYLRQYRRERLREPNYERLGFVKKASR